MRNSLISMLVAVGLVAGCGSSDSPSAATDTSANSVRPAVIVIGDSVTARSKDKFTLDEFDFSISAQSGITIEKQLPAIESAIAKVPHVLVIQLGGNDMSQWGPAIEAEVNQILDEAAVLDCVRWVNLAGAIPDLEKLNQFLADQVGSRSNFAVIDWATAVADHPTWLDTDNVHPSDPDGQVGYAQLVSESVRACPL
ncbi:MAG: hypothetical protein ABI570_05055 [Ilumatobacteraceae bacterium]